HSSGRAAAPRKVARLEPVVQRGVSRGVSRGVVDARQAINYLASDELEGRGIGTKGLDQAADYVAAQFASIGLRPPAGTSMYFQTFDMTTAVEFGPATALRVGDRNFNVKNDFSPLGLSGQGAFVGPVVFAGYGLKSDAHHYDDYAGLDAKGKVVLAMRYEPHDERGKSRFAPDDWSDAAALAVKARLAHEHGAVALLLVTPPEFHDDDRLLGLSQGASRSESTAIPIIHVKRTVAEELLRRGGGGELKALQQRIDQSIKPASFAPAGVQVSGEVDLQRKRVPVKNVIGVLPGELADEYIVIGAHYDHLGRGGGHFGFGGGKQIHNGADDNASGTAALMMIASRFAAGPKPPRSIIFVAFTAEEVGLIGSNEFVKHPPVPLSQMVAMLNLDMVGRIRVPQPATMPATTSATRQATAHFATQATTESRAPVLYVGGAGTAAGFDKVVEAADARSPLQVKDMGRGGIGPSDHMSFALKRIPVLFLFSGLHFDYHRPSDDADKINYQGLNQVVDFAVDLIAQIAAAPRQAYVEASDASPLRIGSPGGGTRVTLGVVPDYSSFEDGGGVRISGTTPGTPAAGAGLKAGDVIVRFDDRKLDTLQGLSDVLARSKAGQKVKLGIMRDKQAIEIEVTLAERKG
ncbi:MAG: M20/M25/M40 family metallo-hydrolase, partial [Tepidisphaeraceae bacterium]